MPVNTIHPDYTSMADAWKRCRDVYAGQDAVHNASVAYLPKLKDQDENDYKAYVTRATFYNASYRTITGLVGMLFRQPPQVKVPATIEPMLDDITMSGVPLHLLVQDVATDSITLGRTGLLVDYPTASAGLTLADAKAQNLRPTIQLYKAESIINWRTGRVNNEEVLVQVVLQEAEKVQEDEFKYKDKPVWRVLDLVDYAVNPRYRVRKFERIQDKDVQIGDDIFPMMNNKSLTYIPFVFIGTDDVTSEVDNPPLIDLINLNLSHYRSTADYEHGAHFTGLPTPVVSGVQLDEGAKLSIGSGTAWVFKSKDAKATYLEFTGQGLEALERILTRKESQMAILGARMLEPQKKGVETAEAASIHRKGEESMLSSVAQAISLAVEKALKWFAEWAGANPEEVEFDLNRDFYPVPMTPEELTALIAAWQAGAISDQTLFDNLQQGEIIDNDTTLEDEQARIANQAPRLQGQPEDGSAPSSLPEPQSHSIHVHLPQRSGNKTVTTPSGATYKVQASD